MSTPTLTKDLLNPPILSYIHMCMFWKIREDEIEHHVNQLHCLSGYSDGAVNIMLSIGQISPFFHHPSRDLNLWERLLDLIAIVGA